MYRLLIVDDEPNIVEGLYKLFIEDDKYELDVCKAYSALDALEKIKKIRFDVILLDIGMPVMSGLELLDEILERWTGCRVIFLTGFREFDYAYQAMHKDKVNYILKSEDDEVVVKAVYDAIKGIEEELEKYDYLLKAKEQVDLALPLLKRELVRDLLSENVIDIFDAADRFNKANVSVCLKLPFVLVLGRFDRPVRLQSDRLRIQIVLLNLLESSMPSFKDMLGAIYDESRFVCMLQVQESQEGVFRGSCWDDIVLYVKGNLENVQNLAKDRLGVSVSFIVSSEPVYWQNISAEYEKLAFFLSSCQADEMIIADTNSITENFQSLEPLNHIAVERRLAELENLFELTDEISFMKGISSFLKAFSQMDHTSPLSKLNILHKLTQKLLEYVLRFNLAQSLEKNGDFLKFLSLCESMHWEEFQRRFCEAGLAVFRRKLDHNKEGMGQIIKKLHTYISNNLGKELSLVRLGEVVHLNPSYLSRIYKQETGECLSDYINVSRVYKAKELLADNRLMINDVASTLGFESLSYFAAFFKRYEGSTPSEYRAILRGQM